MLDKLKCLFIRVRIYIAYGRVVEFFSYSETLNDYLYIKIDVLKNNLQIELNGKDKLEKVKLNNYIEICDLLKIDTLGVI